MRPLWPMGLKRASNGCGPTWVPGCWRRTSCARRPPVARGAEARAGELAAKAMPATEIGPRLRAGRLLPRPGIPTGWVVVQDLPAGRPLAGVLAPRCPPLWVAHGHSVPARAAPVGWLCPGAVASPPLASATEQELGRSCSQHPSGVAQDPRTALPWGADHACYRWCGPGAPVPGPEPRTGGNTAKVLEQTTGPALQVLCYSGTGPTRGHRKWRRAARAVLVAGLSGTPGRAGGQRAGPVPRGGQFNQPGELPRVRAHRSEPMALRATVRTYGGRPGGGTNIPGTGRGAVFAPSAADSIPTPSGRASDPSI